MDSGGSGAAGAMSPDEDRPINPLGGPGPEKPAASSPPPGAALPATLAAAAAPDAVRPDYVQNAVKFLLHPQVRASPQAQRVAFLQKKGLRASEIAEALKIAASSPAQATVPLAGPSVMPRARPPAPNEQQSYSVTALDQQRSVWPRAVLAGCAIAGLAGVAAYVVNRFVVPRLRAKSRAAEQESSEREKVEAAAMLQLELQGIRDNLKTLSDKVANMQETQAAELRSVVSAFQLQLERQTSRDLTRPASARSPGHHPPGLDPTQRSVIEAVFGASSTANGVAHGNSNASAGMADVLRELQHGHVPSDVKDINDSPAVDSPIPPVTANIRLKPWERTSNA